MDKFLIKGGKPLHGTVAISGAEELSVAGDGGASLLTDERVCRCTTFRACGHYHDGEAAGVYGRQRNGGLVSRSGLFDRGENDSHAEAPYDLVKTMRASF